MNNTLKEQARNLPLSPGVYLMKDNKGTIIYIGKAKKLRNRVSSYFVKNKQHSSKVLRLIRQITDFDVINVTTELDALLLECRLIQEYRPFYNRQMNSFEKYKYLEINTDSEVVSINIVSIPTNKNCFGPFSISRKLSELKQILENLYGLNQTNYWQQSFSENHSDSLSQTIIASELVAAFTQDSQLPQKRLEEKMMLAAENHSFEKALKLREDWQFVTRFFNQNKKLILASQTKWQFLSIPIDSKIKYYILYQGLVVQEQLLTQQTFVKYTSYELARKKRPSKRPQSIQQFSKDQVDFINILYSYINHHKECLLVDIEDPFE